MQNPVAKITDKFKRRLRWRELLSLRHSNNKLNQIRDDKTAVCTNCKTQLTGPFCHACGQKDNELKRPIWTFVMEMLDDVFSSDSRLFKTIFMLMLFPGGLTRSFMDGRRARYVMPLRLYLTVSILFFLLISIANIAILDIQVTPKDANATQAAIPEASAKPNGGSIIFGEDEPLIEELQKAAEAIKKDIAADVKTLPPEAQETLNKLFNSKAVQKNIDSRVGDDMQKLEEDMQVIGIQSDDFPYDVKVDMFVKLDGKERVGLTQEDITRITDQENMPEIVVKAVNGFSEALKDPEVMNELMNDWLPPALLILMPLFALVLRMMHWGEARCLMNQLVFSLHFHSVLFMYLILLIIIVPMFGGELGAEIFWWCVTIYFFIALKVGQNQGWFKTIIKFIILWPLYWMMLTGALGWAIFNGLAEV